MAKGNKKNDKKVAEKAVETVVETEVKEEIKETPATDGLETEVVSEFKTDELPVDNLDDAFGEDEEGLTPDDTTEVEETEVLDEEMTEELDKALDELKDKESVDELMKVVDENMNKEKAQQTIAEKTRRRTMREVYGYNWNGMCFDD